MITFTMNRIHTKEHSSFFRFQAAEVEIYDLSKQIYLGPSMGMGNPCGSWVWVPSGYGYGSRKVNSHHNPYPRQWVLTHGGYGCG